MPTPEYAGLVSAVAETIDEVLTADPMTPPDQDEMTHAMYTGGPAHAYVVDYEKVVWHYPDATARLIEE